MTQGMLHIAVIACWALAAGFFAAYVASIAREITYVTLADGRKTERRIPLLLRLLLPLAPNLRRFAARPAFDRMRSQAERMIVSAGLEGLLTANEFVALKFLSPLAAGGLWVLFVQVVSMAMPSSFFAGLRLPLSVLGVLLFYQYPLAFLRKALKARHASIVRSLPFVLDLLTLSVEAGMDFMSALARNCERRTADPLNEELIRMLREIQVGTPRRQALRNLAERTGQPDLRSVVHALVQADELGVSIGSILRIQSDQLRSRRFERAEKLASEAPVKMLGPLMLCIFPAVFVILLGPILLQAAGGGIF